MDIIARYEHSKLGNLFFNLCAKWTKFILKHKWLFYLLACTWGILLTLLGIIIAGILAFCKIFDSSIEFKIYNWVYYISVGPEYWGGFETGLMFLRDHKSNDNYTNSHEFSHSIQNTLFGPFTIFLITIPSACRWWLRELFPNKDWKPYDSFWAEDSATQCGKYVNWFFKK